MDEIDGEILITLPVSGKWVPWANIGGAFLGAVAPAAVAAFILSMSRRFRPLPLPAELLHVFLAYTGYSVIFCLVAAHSLAMHLRWGQVPRTVRVNRNGANFTWLGFRRMRERHWKRDDVISIDMKQVKDVFTHKTINIVRLRLRTKWPRDITLATKDLVLAEQIRERLRDVLQK
jgi:hypothetical protein